MPFYLHISPASSREFCLYEINKYVLTSTVTKLELQLFIYAPITPGLGPWLAVCLYCFGFHLLLQPSFLIVLFLVLIFNASVNYVS